MILSLILAFALQEPGPGDPVPRGGIPVPAQSPFPEQTTAAKENRSLLVVFQSTEEAQKAGVNRLFKDASIRKEIQYEFVVAYRPAPARPGEPSMTSFLIPSRTDQPNVSISYADLLMENGQPSSKKFLQLLKQNECPPWDAVEVLEAARQTAIQENKRLFIHLGAPW